MTTSELADILVKTGLVHPQAVEDPEGFDNYETLGQIIEAAVEITCRTAANAESSARSRNGTGSEAC